MVGSAAAGRADARHKLQAANWQRTEVKERGLVKGALSSPTHNQVSVSLEKPQ